MKRIDHTSTAATLCTPLECWCTVLEVVVVGRGGEGVCVCAMTGVEEVEWGSEWLVGE